MTSYFRCHLSMISLHKITALALVVLVFLAATPSPVLAAEAKDAATKIAAIARSARLKSSGLGTRQRQQEAGPNDGGAMPQRRSVAGVRPQPPRSKAEQEARVAALQINPGSDVVLEGRQPTLFSATPVDSFGAAVQGLHAEWESSDKNVIVIRESGMAIAHQPGTAIVTARVGAASQSVNVTVVQGRQEEFGGKKQEDSTRTNQQDGFNLSAMNGSHEKISKGGTRRAHC